MNKEYHEDLSKQITAASEEFIDISPMLSAELDDWVFRDAEWAI